MSTTDGQQQVSRGLLITLGVVVGLAALYALWVFVVSPLLEGDEEPGPVATAPADPTATDPDAAPTDPDTGQVDPDAQPDADLDELDVVPETFEIFTARDPFQQLVVEAPAAPSSPTDGTVDNNVDGTDGDTTNGGDNGATGGGTGDNGTGGTGTDGTDGTGTNGTNGTGTNGTNGTGTGEGMAGGDMTDGDGGGETAPDSANVGSTTIALVDVFIGDDGEPVLQVSVNDRVYEVREGDVFAERFRVLTVDGVCATFLFGDSRFTLCEGEQIVK